MAPDDSHRRKRSRRKVGSPPLLGWFEPAAQCPHHTSTSVWSRERGGLRLPPLPQTAERSCETSLPATPFSNQSTCTLRFQAREPLPSPGAECYSTPVLSLANRKACRVPYERDMDGGQPGFHAMAICPERWPEALLQAPNAMEFHAIGRIFAQLKVSNRVRSERKQHHDSNDVPRKSGFPFHRAAARPPLTAILACPWIMSSWPESCARPDLTN